MKNGVFENVNFVLPRNGKLKMARAIGDRCGDQWWLDGSQTVLPSGYPEEVASWSQACRRAWRIGFYKAWHRRKEATWPVLGAR